MSPGFINKQSIINVCQNPSPSQILSRLPYGFNVIKVSEDAIVKLGPVAAIEVEVGNQRKAFNLIDPAIVRVPKVLGHFNHDSQGYIVMEHMKGLIVDDLDDRHYQKIAIILAHFGCITGRQIGNLSGEGLVYHCLFLDEGVPCRDLESVSRWFNERTCDKNTKVTFESHTLRLCHRDLAPRNFLWDDENDTAALLDWQTAGFFPVEFELCTQINGKDAVLNKRIEEILLSLSPVNVSNSNALLKAWYNSQRYSFNRDMHVKVVKAPKQKSRRPIPPELKKFLQNRPAMK